jgi:hypothetical protein
MTILSIATNSAMTLDMTFNLTTFTIMTFGRVTSSIHQVKCHSMTLLNKNDKYNDNTYIRIAKCNYVGCHDAERHYAECNNTDCHGANCHM